MSPSSANTDRRLNQTPESFPGISFAGTLRPSQQEAVQVAKQQLEEGKRRLHIVAPPGSGKTVLGLYLWAEFIKRPCLVLSPNSAVQSQWAARTDLFHFPGNARDYVSTEPKQPSLLTSLTYQSVTLPIRQADHLDAQAIELWCDKLIEAQQALDVDEAKVWIGDLREHNPDYFKQRFAAYKKQVRDEIAIEGSAISMLHPSSREVLDRLANLSTGVLILDECHHLMGHWGRVLADALSILDQPVVIGLTATPPDRRGKDPRDIERYDQFFGEVDFEVPVPAVVKDGFLAPYQDLAYFVRPASEELKFIASADRRLKRLVESLCEESASNSELTDELNKTDENAIEQSDQTPNIASAFDKSEIDEETLLAADPLTNGDDDVAEDSEQAEPESRNLVDWLQRTLATLRLPTGTAKSWLAYSRRDPVFSLAARQFLDSRGIDLPGNVPQVPALQSHTNTPAMEYWVPVLDRYIRHHLRRSRLAHERDLADSLTSSLRMLGIQVTETGTQACASPVGRVMAYSSNKAAAVVPILTAEMSCLGNEVRAVVIADFEKSSAVAAEIKHLMDAEAGGAIAAYKMILSDPTTDQLEPILVTGSTVLVDDEIESEFLQRSRQWLADRDLDVSLAAEHASGFHLISGTGGDWSPRVYVEMITELFQQGFTRCLVGTRGLLGEGWDANRVNVLIDLTTVTTSMSINQLRGRSIRLDPLWPEKLSNNWDVVCIAPELTKGFDDYRRFIEKHRSLYGVTDDGVIEKGVGHVHPAFTEIKPEGLESSTAMLNDEMISRASWRSQVRDLWKIGQPYKSLPIQAVEAKMSGAPGGFPPFAKMRDPWNQNSLTQAIAKSVLGAFIDLRKIRAGAAARAGDLSGGYVRVFLQNASPGEQALFAQAMREVLGPLDRPRYVIERQIEQRSETWISYLLPDIIGRYFQRKRRVRAMLHAVPSELAKKKQIVAVFERHWNRYVSPGRAVYAHRGAGEQMVANAKRLGQAAAIALHDKEVFI